MNLERIIKEQILEYAKRSKVGMGGAYSVRGDAGSLGSGARNRGRSGGYPLPGHADDGDEGPPQNEAESPVLSNFELIKKRKGFDPRELKLLGQGFKGKAYDIGDGRVFKLTMDASEAMAAKRIMERGRDLKHVVRVEDVFKLQNVDLFGIIMEKLQPLTPREDDELERIRIIRSRTSQLRQAVQQGVEKAKEFISTEFEDGPELVEIMERYDLFEAMRELNSIGVVYTDYHDGNVMKRGSEYVVIDPGVSLIKGGKLPAVIERALVLNEKETPMIRDMLNDPRVRQLLAKRLGQDAKLPGTYGSEDETLTGEGYFGAVYDLENGRVLKVTEDQYEAKTANHLKGKPTKRIVRVYDVFKFPWGSNPSFYGIVQEKLEPIGSTEQFVLNRDFGYTSPTSKVDWNTQVDRARADGDDEAVEAYDQLSGEPYDIGGIVDELKSLNIIADDFHAGNIMKRGETYVLIDPSRAKSPGTEPAELESIIREQLLSLMEHGEPDVDPEKLPEFPERFGYNEDGYELAGVRKFNGLPIAIEQAKGSTREWRDRDGNEGVTTMVWDYGYVIGTEGADGDAVDVYLGPDEESPWAFVVHQMAKPDFEKYDEDKVMLGFGSEEEAKKAYLEHFDDDQFYGGMSSMPFEEFVKKLVGQPAEKITNEAYHVVQYDMREAQAKKRPKGIPHLEDLKPDEFMRWLRKYRDVELEGGLEVSEKVDGSAKMDFGVDERGLWVRSKNGPKMYDSSAWGDRPMLRALRSAHEALESKADAIRAAWPEGVEGFSSEVLYTRIPNSIEYGPNVVMIHGVTSESGKTVSPDESKAAAQRAVEATGGRLKSGDEEWRFEYKPVIDVSDVMVDVRNEYDSLGDVYDSLKRAEPDRRKKAGKPVYQAHLTRFKELQKAVKAKLVKQLRGMRSVYGPEGGDVEGVVFRDLEDDSLVKLVDREYFTRLNKFMWHYRELLERGIKLGDEWKVGVLQSFRDMVADDVMGAPVAKTPGFVRYLARRTGSVDFPPDADTPEKRAEHLLGEYIENEGLMEGDFLSRFKQAAAKARKQFEEIRNEWDEEKSGPPVFDVKDDSGEVIKRVKMDPIIVKRTDDAMGSMEVFLDDIDRMVSKTSSISDDLTRKVALLKIMMGNNRFGKLATAVSPKKNEAAGDSLFSDVPKDHPGEKPLTDPGSMAGLDVSKEHDAKKVLQKNAELLKDRKGIDVSGARPLGVGTQGTAFDIGGDRVLKVTKDQNEALASNKLIDKNLKHVVRIFDVFRFKGDQAWGIVQERLEPMSPEEKKEFNQMLIFTGLPVWLKRASSWDAAEEAVMKYVEKQKAGGDVTSEKGKRALRWADQFLDRLQSKYDVRNSWEELRDNGIKFSDYQADNLMKRGDDHVLIDVGLSEVTGGTQLDILESTIREIVMSTILSEDSRGNMTRILGLPKGLIDKIHEEHGPKKAFVVGAAIRAWRLDRAENKKDPWKIKMRLKRGETREEIENDDVWDDVYDLWKNKLGGAGDATGQDIIKMIDHPLGWRRAESLKNSKDWSEWLRAFSEWTHDAKQEGNVMLRLSGGFKWVDLNKHVCPDEGEAMGHCGADERGTLVSLRDKMNKPHVTMTWNKDDNEVLQIKGKQNRLPNRKYWGHIKKFFDKTNAIIEEIEFDAADLGNPDSVAFIKSLGLFDNVPDVAKVDLPESSATWKYTGVIQSDWHVWNFFDENNSRKYTAYADDDAGKIVHLTPAGKIPHDKLRAIFDVHPPDDSVKKKLGIKETRSLTVELDDIISETLRESLRESDPEHNNIPDNIGVTIGRFQPFTRGHSELVRDLARRFTKVIIIVAGNKRDKKNPFSYETRVDMMKKSLADVLPKLEVYKAEFGGRPSGFIPGVLSDIIKDHSSSIEGEMAMNVLVGEDRYESMKKQIDSAKGMVERGDELLVNPDLINVQKLPRSDDAEGVEGISATKVRQALINNDIKYLKKAFDPHLSSNEVAFTELVQKLRDEMGVDEPKTTTEAEETRTSKRVTNDAGADLDSVGGEKTIVSVLKASADKLKKKGVSVPTLKVLGHGQMGIAYDMGGGKVLKVTTDADEARASNVLKTKQGMPNVVKVYDVFQFPNTEDPLFGVISEKLTELSPSEKADVARATDYIRAEGNEAMLEAIATKNWDEFSNELYQHIHDDVVQELGGDPDNPGIKNRARKIATRKHGFITNLLKKYDVPGMVKSLRSAGIEFADYHEDNVMKRGSEYVINDIGKSKSQGPDPDVLEIVESVVIEILGEAMGGVTAGTPGTSMSMGGVGRYAATGAAQSSPWSSAKMMYTDDERESDPDAPPKRLPEDRDLTTNIRSGKFIPWTEEQARVYTPSRQGTGPGELSFAMAMGGDQANIVGGHAAYDVEIDGMKWEVKEPDKSGYIRPGTHGTADIGELREIGRQLEKLADMDEKSWEVFEELTDGALDASVVKEFIDKQLPHIISGREISAGRILGREKVKGARVRYGLYQIMKMLAYVANCRECKVDVRIAGKMHYVPVGALANFFFDQLGIPESELGVDIDEIDKINAILRHRAFRDPDKILEIWRELISPHDVFGHVDGVVIVNEKGFIPILRRDLDDYLVFKKISQSIARFKFVP